MTMETMITGAGRTITIKEALHLYLLKTKHKTAGLSHTEKFKYNIQIIKKNSLI